MQRSLSKSRRPPPIPSSKPAAAAMVDVSPAREEVRRSFWFEVRADDEQTLNFKVSGKTPILGSRFLVPQMGSSQIRPTPTVATKCDKDSSRLENKSVGVWVARL